MIKLPRWTYKCFQYFHQNFSTSTDCTELAAKLSAIALINSFKQNWLESQYSGFNSHWNVLLSFCSTVLAHNFIITIFTFLTMNTSINLKIPPVWQTLENHKLFSNHFTVKLSTCNENIHLYGLPHRYFQQWLCMIDIILFCLGCWRVSIQPCSLEGCLCQNWPSWRNSEFSPS